MSPIKEPNYFCVSVNPNIKLSQMFRDKKKYLNLFKNVKDEIAIGEASVPYLWDPKAPLLIHEAVPDARIIMILRDPVERALSHYLLLAGLGSENLSFSDAIRKAIKAKPDYSGRIIETGLYFEQVKRYEKIFGLDQIKIIIFEEFVAERLSHYICNACLIDADGKPKPAWNELSIVIKFDFRQVDN